MGNNSVPKFIFRLSRFPVYGGGSVLGRFYCIQYVYLLNKYLKCSVWRLALRYDIYIYICVYMSLGFKRLMMLVINAP